MEELPEGEGDLYCIGLLFHRKVVDSQIQEEASENGQESDFDDNVSHNSFDSGENGENMLSRVRTAIRKNDGLIQEGAELSEEGSDVLEEGGELDESLNLKMSAFFASNVKLNQDYVGKLYQKKNSGNWHAVRLEIDLADWNTQNN